MRQLWNNQFENLFLWVPFLMAFGAAMYFTCNAEPKIVFPWIFVIIFGAIVLWRRVPILLRGTTVFAFGFMYAMAFTHTFQTPQIAHPLRDATVIGTVQNIDYTDNRARIFIRTAPNQITTSSATIRVSTQLTNPTPKIGDTVSATVNLYRPSPAYAPNTFDYARWAYFNHLTATGYIKDFKIITSDDGAHIAKLRNYLHTKTNSFLSDSLVLGYKNAVPRDDGPVWTAVGIGHVWSISGFHVTLVSGWLFAIFFGIFRLIAPITRRVPARIPATICAWIGLGFYLFLSGCDVATMRAFLMASFVFIAIIIGRDAISLRNVCVAMLVIFCINPHYVMQAGFQLSFAAIFGLVWFWSVIRPRTPENKILKFLYTATMTSIVATIFTAPFVVAHFYSFPLYGLIGNLVLLPIFSVAIMPLVIVGTITATFGLTFPLHWADNIYNMTLTIAHKIVAVPGATVGMPHIPNVALVIFILAFMVLVLLKFRTRKINCALFAAIAALGIIVTIASPRPIFMATYDHELVGFVQDDELIFNKSRASNHYFAFNTWKQLRGEKTDTLNTRKKHDHGVYTFDTPKFKLIYIQKFVPLAKNIVQLCRDDNVKYIVSYFNIDAPHCNHKILRNGFVIYPSGRVKYVPINRPWHSRPQ